MTSNSSKGNSGAYWLEAGPARVEIDPGAGGRIAALEIAGLSVLVPRTEDRLRWGCYPMAPWAGRLRDGRFRFADRNYEVPRTMPPHAIHGTTLDRGWASHGKGRMSIDLGPDWPFSGRVFQEITLEPDGLSLRIEIRSDRTPFPAGAGWHPWFRRQLGRGGSAELEFEAGAMYARDRDGIPSGRLVPPTPGPWDDCFTDLSSGPRLTWPGAVQISLSSSVDHWVVYNEPSHALCVEPQTGPPDALNLAPVLVTPERPLRAETRIHWRIE